MISANNVTLRIGKKALFEDVNIKFTEGNCYGAIAWLLADVITFYPEIALKFLQETKLDKFTVNKAIQKARESYRVPSDLKELLLTYKR